MIFKGAEIKDEIIAGLTTFMTMVYIVFVNPQILSAAGMDFDAVMLATILSASVITIIAGIYTNLPFALAAGMGLNAYFAYSVCVGMNISWQVALAAVFIDGIIFLIISILPIREDMVKAIPMSLKLGTSVGIGLFIALIGMVNAGLVVSDPGTLISLGDLTAPQTLLAIFGLMFMAILTGFRVKGALLFGIIGTTLLGWIFGIPARPESISDIFALPNFSSLSNTFLQMDFAGVFKLGLVWVIITFTFVDLFDTLGAATGLATKLDMIDEEGSFKGARRLFIVDSIGTIFGSILGTSTVTTYVESASGVAEGGRTGLTSVVTGLAFLSTLFLVPFAKLIPPAATAPALIMVGLFMMEPVLKIDLKDITNALPAFLIIVAIPFTYSISNGIMLGIISYTIIKVLTKRWNEVSIAMYILTAIFIIYISYPALL
ncbi:MAG: Permease family protein [Candidatus Methanolliviera sp. GoM_oil]|nr:MAG: Permease family protein [Candidatus Methanolliviera sp. GoM_oil]